VRRSVIDPAPQVARINVTPIIDVALVLVIVLLITAPMIAVSDMDVKLPHAKTRSIESDARINVTVGMDGSLAFDELNITAGQLGRMIAERIAKDGDDLMVVVRADEGVSYDIVEDILRISRESGARRLGIATQQSGKVKVKQ
jgi:biopolymer transport protein TolR